MAETKHTPGPLVKGTKHLWEGLSMEDKTLQVFLLSGPNNETVALIPLWPDKTKEQEANADLFAAASELLEALTALGVMPEGYCFCHQNRDPLKVEKEHTGECRDARAAIAKVTPEKGN